MNANQEIAKGIFISRVLQKESVAIKSAMDQVIASNGFTSPELVGGRNFSVNESVLSYRHNKVHRFVDMKTRMTAAGKRKKTSYPIHNRILFGHANNIVRELSVGFTEGVRDSIVNQMQDGEL